MAGLFTPLSPAVASLQTLLNRHGNHAVFATPGAEWRLRPAGSDSFEGPRLYGALGDSEVTVWLAEPDWRLAAGPVLGAPPEEVTACPEPFVRAALESMASGALEALERSTGLAAAVKSLEMTPSRPVGSLVHFSMADGGGRTVRFAALFSKPEGQWFAALERCLAGLPATEHALPDDLPVPAEVFLARMTVAASELEGMEPGDVVVFPTGGGWLVRVGGNLCFRAECGMGVLRVEGKGMSDAMAAEAGGGEEPVGIDSVEVEVTAQVGRVRMTLAELRRLGAGQVVEFATPVDRPARLVVGGKTVAEGELVDVGGRVGVRITAMGDR